MGCSEEAFTQEMRVIESGVIKTYGKKSTRNCLRSLSLLADKEPVEQNIGKMLHNFFKNVILLDIDRKWQLKSAYLNTISILIRERAENGKIRIRQNAEL